MPFRPRPGAERVRVCTLDRCWYVHEVRGANYLSWVTAADRPYAAAFPAESVDKWVPLLEETAGIELVYEEV